MSKELKKANPLELEQFSIEELEELEDKTKTRLSMIQKTKVICFVCVCF